MASLDRFRPQFPRHEAWQRAFVYMYGLLNLAERPCAPTMLVRALSFRRYPHQAQSRSRHYTQHTVLTPV